VTVYERPDPDRPETSRERAISPTLIILLVVAVVAIVFVVQNTEENRIELLFWSFTSSVWVAIALALLLGALLGQLVATLWRRRRRSR
jgi:uncharacterized integral membrane protein